MEQLQRAIWSPATHESTSKNYSLKAHSGTPIVFSGCLHPTEDVFLSVNILTYGRGRSRKGKNLKRKRGVIEYMSLFFFYQKPSNRYGIVRRDIVPVQTPNHSATTEVLFLEFFLAISIRTQSETSDSLFDRLGQDHT